MNISTLERITIHRERERGGWEMRRASEAGERGGRASVKVASGCNNLLAIIYFSLMDNLLIYPTKRVFLATRVKHYQ